MISQRRKRTKGFSRDEKNLLIHCVMNHGSVRADWEFIAETLDKTGMLLSISTNNYLAL